MPLRPDCYATAKLWVAEAIMRSLRVIHKGRTDKSRQGGGGVQRTADVRMRPGTTVRSHGHPV